MAEGMKWNRNGYPLKRRKLLIILHFPQKQKKTTKKNRKGKIEAEGMAYFMDLCSVGCSLALNASHQLLGGYMFLMSVRWITEQWSIEGL